MLDQLLTTENLVALVTLASLEIVLGIDNIVFIAILVAKLPTSLQSRARRLGLLGAMVTRIVLLAFVSWIVGLTAEIFRIPMFWTHEVSDGLGISGRDLILLGGGLFLLAKATHEIHSKLEGADHHEGGEKKTVGFASTVVQIMLIDVVFSLDSVITAVGMVRTRPGAEWVGLTIMIAAVVVAVLVMMAFAGRISDFVYRHPTIKMLALSFLLLIGVMLVVEGLHGHIPRGYLYFAMAFSLGVELLNMRAGRTGKPRIQIFEDYIPSGGQPPTS